MRSLKRQRVAARAAEQDRPVGPLVDRPQQPGALGRAEVAEAVEAEQPVLERRGERRVGQHAGLLEVAHVDEQQRAAGGGGHDRRGVGSADHQRQPGRDREQLLHLGDGRLAARHRRRDVDATGRDRRAHVAEPARRAEQERRQPVGDLHRAVGERGRAVERQQPDQAAGGQRAGGGEAAEHVAAPDALAGQQVGGEARAGEPAGDVVLEVGVQEAVAPVQLGRRADGQDRAVERVEAEPLSDRGHPGVGVERRRPGGERQRLLVGDVEAAQALVGAAAGRGGAFDRGPQAFLQEAEADGGRLSRRRHAPPRRLRAHRRRRAGSR